MYQILKRIRLILACLAWIFIFSIDEELFLFAIWAFAFVYFFLLSDTFISESLKEWEKYFWKEKTWNTWISKDISQEKVTVSKEYEVDTVWIHENPDEIYRDLTEDRPIQNIAINDQSEYEDTPREPNTIERFFSENLLAKIWGILVFLWVLFLLSLIYSIIGPVTKMCVWLAIGFSCYGAGIWMDKKWYTWESRIVMGTAILINFLVILSGRHLLWTDVCEDIVWWSCQKDTILSVGITFFFLILNTVFAVVTSLVYNSRPLLIFGFVFAYLNPLLLGTSSSEPYTLLWYTMIVTLWAMYMAYTRKDEILFPLSFILAACMFLIAPWNDGAWWTTKLLCINTLGVVSLYVSTVFEKKYQHLWELLIGGTFFLIGVMWFLWIENLSVFQLIIMWASSIGLMILCYAHMSKWAYLYSIWSLWTVLTLTPALLINGLSEDTIFASICIIWVFAVSNIWVILTKSKELLAGNLWNIISGLISGALFLTFMIYEFGSVYFPWMMQGFVFFFLAIIYCCLAFIVVQKTGIEEIKTDEKYQNTFYTISAIGISLFSLAVAFVFSENKEIISIVWLLEASILFFLAEKTCSVKIAAWALVLFVIGITRIIPFIWEYISWDYGMLVALCIITASLLGNLYILFQNSENKASYLWNEYYGIHNFFHVIGIITVVILGFKIFDLRWDWLSLLYSAWAISLLWIIYLCVKSPGLQKIYFIFYIFFLFLHISIFTDDMWRDQLELWISTVIAGLYALPLIYDYTKNADVKHRGILSCFVWYIFILSTLYIYHIFDVTFAVTLYWGILSFILLSYGISKDILYLRTIGLYLITLTAGKVFLYDIWMSVDDTVSRVIALIVVGILMIILSTMYTRKYGNNLNAEFSPENLFPKDISEKKTSVTKQSDLTPQESVKVSEKQESSLMQEIQKTDVSNYSAVRMKISGVSKTFTIRAVNLVKIAKIIEAHFGKNTFSAGELSEIQKNVLAEYKSELPESQFKKLKEVVAAFVKHGWEIEFIEKK